ncbi:MAG: hypothetical protein U9N73_09055, partial [Candidatus Auribacterota bacterium]|nr:hypothetical protein [Candidatus Auribacterota bacterium]
GVFLMMTLVVTLGTGIRVSWADYGNARINARAAEDISQRFRGEDVEITFTGELGFRYYLETKGYEYLLSDIGHLKPGEILVEPGNYLQGGISPELMQHLDLIERMEYPVSPIITLLSRANRTDFYGQYYGFLPYFPAGGERHFNLYRYETPARYKKLTGTSSGGIPDIMPRHTFSNYLSLLDWNINRATPEQGDRLEITLRWRVEDGFNPDFRTYLRLNNRYSPLVLIHDIRKDEPGLRDWRKGDIVEELYTIAHISKNTYPGKYEVSTGLIPKKDSSTRSSQLTGIKYEDYVIGTVDIEPRIYRNDLIPDREERYFPQLRQFSGRLLSFSLTRDKEVNIPVDLPGPVSSIRIISFLAYGFALRDGEKIARITVVDNDGDDHTFYFKVGRDTADWAIDHPGYDRSIYKHHIAEVYNRWRVTHRGTSGWGYKYITYLRFEKPIIPVKVIMKYVNNVGVLIVEDLSAEESVI